MDGTTINYQLNNHNLILYTLMPPGKCIFVHFPVAFSATAAFGWQTLWMQKNKMSKPFAPLKYILGGGFQYF